MSTEVLGGIVGGLALLAIWAFMWWITGPVPGDKRGNRK